MLWLNQLILSLVLCPSTDKQYPALGSLLLVCNLKALTGPAPQAIAALLAWARLINTFLIFLRHHSSLEIPPSSLSARIK